MIEFTLNALVFLFLGIELSKCFRQFGLTNNIQTGSYYWLF